MAPSTACFSLLRSTCPVRSKSTIVFGPCNLVGIDQSAASMLACPFVLLSGHQKQISPNVSRISEDTFPSPLLEIGSEATSVTPRNRCCYQRFRERVPALLFAPSLSLGVRGVRPCPLKFRVAAHCATSKHSCYRNWLAWIRVPWMICFPPTRHCSNIQRSPDCSPTSELRRPMRRTTSCSRELFALREMNPAVAGSLLVLAFLPMLHRAVRLITRQQESLAEEDITQQVLFFFLQFLGSPAMQTRHSHFAFAIAREVKRHIFEWAKRESAKAALLDRADAEAGVFIELEDSFEQYALLRHFLHRCLTRGMLADSELDLLTQFKLDGNSGEELAALNGSSSNAMRQRCKRLLAKLRRLAR